MKSVKNSGVFRVMLKSNLVVFAILILLTLSGSKVLGQERTSDSISNAKLKFLTSALAVDHQKTALWWWGWLGGYSAATVAQGAIYFASDNKTLKQDMALGAATTLLGAAGQFISPFKPNNEFARFSSLPENTEEERRQKLAEAEKLIRIWSERERKALTWENHILSTAVNVGGGLITWFGFKRTWKDGLVNFAINEVVTEAQIWIQPTYAKRYYKKYRERFINGEEPYSYVPEVNWYIQAMPGGVGVKITF